MDEFVSAIAAPDLMKNICEWSTIRKLVNKNNLKFRADLASD